MASFQHGMHQAHDATNPDDVGTSPAELKRVLAAQQAAAIANGPPAVAERVRRLELAINLLLDNADEITAAVAKDFGVRPEKVTRFADLLMALESCKQARDKVAAWAAPQRRVVDFPFNLVGATNYIEYTPKGVVGIVGPWNYPVMLVIGPLASAFAAGNSVMIKPSEYAPATAAILGKLVNAAYDETVAHVCNGGASVAAAFCALPFDHIVFTGSTTVGKLVAKAAAENLTPVTLELGGKCPVIIGADANIANAAARVAHGKVLNAGQTCLAPDYVFVPRAKRDAFIAAFEEAVSSMYPDGVLDSADYTSVIDGRHYARLRSMIDGAAAAGCPTVECLGGGGDGKPRPAADACRIPPTLVLDAPDGIDASEEEIFGPVMCIRAYDAVDDALAYVNARPRPLALYYFGTDAAEEAKVLARTTSGGVTINDCIMHCAQEDLPFGGVGASGYGRMRGWDGFRELSNARGVHRQVALHRQYLLDGIYPPYNRQTNVIAPYLKLKFNNGIMPKVGGFCTIL
mmetsp:Transcript_26335/g.79439  ORF Transcript_26335/g.79439 Transcript_26335/m.79439 type:complete len:517 (-) Transcript_26335:53-1603(-)